MSDEDYRAYPCGSLLSLKNSKVLRPFVWAKIKSSDVEICIDSIDSDSSRMRYIEKFEYSVGQGGGSKAAKISIFDNTGVMREVFRILQMITKKNSSNYNEEDLGAKQNSDQDKKDKKPSGNLIGQVLFAFGWCDDSGKIVAASNVHDTVCGNIEMGYKTNGCSYTINCLDLVSVFENAIDGDTENNVPQTLESAINGLLSDKGLKDAQFGDGLDDESMPDDVEVDRWQVSKCGLKATIMEWIKKVKSKRGRPLQYFASDDPEYSFRISDSFIGPTSDIYGPLSVNGINKDSKNLEIVISFSPNINNNWLTTTQSESCSAAVATRTTMGSISQGQKVSPANAPSIDSMFAAYQDQSSGGPIDSSIIDFDKAINALESTNTQANQLGIGAGYFWNCNAKLECIGLPWVDEPSRMCERIGLRVYYPYSAGFSDSDVSGGMMWRRGSSNMAIEGMQRDDGIDLYFSGEYQINGFTHSIDCSGKFTTSFEIIRVPATRTDNSDPIGGDEEE